MPSTFEQSGLRFEYPENWSLDHAAAADAEDNIEQVVVSSPNTAFWHLSRYPLDTDLEGLYDEALAALRSEYPDMETEPSAEMVVEDHSLVGFDVNFICLDLTNTCWLRGFQSDDATFLLFCQAEDRELAQVGIVFQAMLASLLRNL